MRVLMLGWELPPNNSGGLGVACLQLSKALADSGADIIFVLPNFSAPNYDFMKIISTSAHSAKGINYPDYIEAYESYRYAMAGGDFSTGVNGRQSAYEKQVAEVVEQNEFDVIHAHDWLTFRAALLARQKSNCPLVLHVHSVERDRAGGMDGNPWVREIEATSMLLADHIFAVSQRTKRMIVEEYSIPADKIEVVHNSLDTASFEQLDSQNAYKYLSDLKNDDWRIVANVGRLTIQKGLTHLLAAAKEVISRLPKTIFLFVGDGDQRDELIQLAADYGIGKNVIFTGFQRGKNWRDAYAIADLFVMPSVSEPFGLTPFEAAGYGTPSLISRQSGAAEVLQNCLKVDFWDIKLMADKMVGALSSQPLLDELAANSLQEFYRLSWSSSANKIMARYQRVISMAEA